MKKQELIKIIELVVRKEVKKQVNEIFIKEGINSFKEKTKEVPSSLTQIAEQEYIQPKPKKKEFKEYTKNCKEVRDKWSIQYSIYCKE